MESPSRSAVQLVLSKYLRLKIKIFAQTAEKENFVRLTQKINDQHQREKRTDHQKNRQNLSLNVCKRVNARVSVQREKKEFVLLFDENVEQRTIEIRKVNSNTTIATTENK